MVSGKQRRSPLQRDLSYLVAFLILNFMISVFLSVSSSSQSSIARSFLSLAPRHLVAAQGTAERILLAIFYDPQVKIDAFSSLPDSSLNIMISLEIHAHASDQRPFTASDRGHKFLFRRRVMPGWMQLNVSAFTVTVLPIGEDFSSH